MKHFHKLAKINLLPQKEKDEEMLEQHFSQKKRTSSK